MKSLVTGGHGFIGSHIVDLLIENGHEVVVIDNHSADCNDFYYENPKAKNYYFDICDYDSTKNLYESVDYVFHLAADSRLQPTIENPTHAIHNNVYGTSVVLECSRQAGVKKVVFSSTSSIYGLRNSKLKVDDQPDILNPYALSKLQGEQLCQAYEKIYGLKSVSLRYFSVFGERAPQKGQYALVSSIFLRQRKEGSPLTVTGTGEQQRDFIYVKDIARANLIAATTETIDPVLNVGTGIGISILELAKNISDRIEFIAARPGESIINIADTDKTKFAIAWMPRTNILDWINQ